MPTVFETPQELLDACGADLGVTDWLEITQERINLSQKRQGITSGYTQIQRRQRTALSVQRSRTDI